MSAYDLLRDGGPILGAVITVIALLARIVTWRLRVRDVQRFNAALAAAPNDVARAIIRRNPPPEPSSDLTKIGILVLICSGASVGLPIALGSQDSPAIGLDAEGNADRCEKASDCGPGCACRDNLCRCAAGDRRKRRKPEQSQRGPQSSMAALPLRRFAGEPAWTL